MAGVDDVKAAVSTRVESGQLIDRIAERIGARMQASAVFGQPVERGEITIIPVAKATWGFGGGASGDSESEGMGGGGGGLVSPLGYIEVRDTGATFKRTQDPRLLASAAAALSLAAVALTRARSSR